jgi:O-antigen ligase
LVWENLIRKIGEHPWVGSGFNKTLVYDNMIYVIAPAKHIHEGWTYNHNDFLSFGMYLGVPALICILWFAGSMIKRSWNSVMLIPALAIVLLCSFQMTMFDIGKASIILAIIVLIILHTTNKGEQYA